MFSTTGTCAFLLQGNIKELSELVPIKNKNKTAIDKIMVSLVPLRIGY